MLKTANKKFKLIVALAAVSLSVYLSVKYLLPLVIPFIIAYLIARYINRPAVWLTEKLHLKKGIAVGILLILLIVIIGYIGSMVVHKFFEQLQALALKWPYFEGVIREKLEVLCSGLEEKMGFEDGRVLSIVNDNLSSLFEKGRNNIMPAIMGTSLPALIGLIDILVIVVIICIAIFFIAKDMEKIGQIKKSFIFSKELNMLTSKLSIIGNAYVKAQIVIMFITSVICFLGFKIIGNPYAMLLGIILGLLDALPLIGIGAMLIPWTIVYLVMGQYLNAGIIFITFTICYLVRELLEPRLIGRRAGIHPLISVISMYIGYKLFGIIGVLFGPLSYIIIAEIMKEVYNTIYAPENITDK